MRRLLTGVLATALLTAGVAVAVIAGPTPAARAGDAEVSVLNNRYSPDQTTIGVGFTVRWTFGEGVHTVTSTSGHFDSHPACLSGGACGQPPQTFSKLFDTPGIYDYFCKLHGGQTGRITVPGPEPSGSASPTPTASPTSPPPAPTLIAPTAGNAGQVITVSGAAPAGSTVDLWGVTAPNAAFAYVKSTTATSSGTWSTTVRLLRNVNLQSRVGEGRSPTRYIAVSTTVNQRTTPLAGCVLQVSGSVFEPKPGRPAIVRARTSQGTTIELGRPPVQSDGRFLLRARQTCGARLTTYVVMVADAANRAGTSPAQTVLVQR